MSSAEISTYSRITNDIWHVSFLGVTFGPLLSGPVIFTITTIPHAKEAGEFRVASLLTQ